MEIGLCRISTQIHVHVEESFTSVWNRLPTHQQGDWKLKQFENPQEMLQKVTQFIFPHPVLNIITRKASVFTSTLSFTIGVG